MKLTCVLLLLIISKSFSADFNQEKWYFNLGLSPVWNLYQGEYKRIYERSLNDLDTAYKPSNKIPFSLELGALADLGFRHKLGVIYRLGFQSLSAPKDRGEDYLFLQVYIHDINLQYLVLLNEYKVGFITGKLEFGWSRFEMIPFEIYREDPIDRNGMNGYLEIGYLIDLGGIRFHGGVGSSLRFYGSKMVFSVGPRFNFLF